MAVGGVVEMDLWVNAVVHICHRAKVFLNRFYQVEPAKVFKLSFRKNFAKTKA